MSRMKNPPRQTYAYFDRVLGDIGPHQDKRAHVKEDVDRWNKEEAREKGKEAREKGKERYVVAKYVLAEHRGTE